MKIMAKLSYDGKKFYGYQKQPKQITVQGQLEKALKVLNKVPTKVNASGRTDKGVSAKGQVVSFEINFQISILNLKNALNSLLEKEIRVLSLKKAPENFDPRFSAIKRKYSYQILNSKNYYPWELNKALLITSKLNLDNLNKMASFLVGVHDFTSFSSSRDTTKVKVKEIHEASFIRKGKYIIFQITGSSFLWKMVRSIVGTIIDIEIKKESPEKFNEILKSKDRKKVRKTAIPEALFLEKVYYE